MIQKRHLPPLVVHHQIVVDIILLTPGAFYTPWSVIKNMTSRTRPKAEEVQEEMKKLEEVGLGEFHCFSSKESAFYKVIPEKDSQELTASVTGDKWETYKQKFLAVDNRYITATQHDRILNLASEKTSSYSMELLINSTKCNQPLDYRSNSSHLNSHVYGTS